MKKIIFALIAMLPLVSFAQENLTLRQKAARMLIIGFRGTEVNENSAIIKDITQLGIGGVILFEHNITPVEKKLNSIERLSDMCAKLQAAAPYKLVISIDQEGGKVNRLKQKYGFPLMVSQQYLGEKNNEDTTRYYAGVIASELEKLNINTNFTPCVDVNINPECPVIGKIGRSFSSNPNEVAKHSMFVIDEHHKKGILTSVKHFPGHGSSLKDSHLGLTDVTETWQEEELIPYQTILADNGCDMVMISHVFNRNLDPDYPATLSYNIITGILREQLGWQGVVVTDDMHMKAISANYPLTESLVRTINAGTDMIILSSNIPGNTSPISEQAIEIIVKAVKEGRISEARIDESIQRINLMLDKLPEK